MTDRPVRTGAAHRVARANPAPRRALPRVTPLAASGSLPGEPERSPSGPSDEEATGRDLLIPNGGGSGAGTRRKGRASATVPTLAELMPPSRPHAAGKPAKVKEHPEKEHPEKQHGEKEHGGKDGKEPNHAKDGKAKEIELQVTLSKGLRKRLRAKSAELGLSPEDAVAQLVEVWVDG
jgi:hypothetical protein